MNGLQKSTYKSINSTISVGKDSLENGVEAEKIYEAVNACYAKSGKTGDSSLDESNKSSESDKTQSRRYERLLVAAALCFVRHNFKKFVRNY